MEKLLHYVWKHKILPLCTLQTKDGNELEIIDVGLQNTNQGADFFNAKVRIDGTYWAGNVEIHLKSSDWFQHGHHEDPAYNNTILHVVEKADCMIETEDGRHPAQLELAIPSQVALHYEELQKTEDYPRCYRLIPQLDTMKIHCWLDALLAERIEQRADRVLGYVKQLNGDWEQATFITLSRNFGFGLNGDTFEMWAKRIPLQAVAKHRDQLFQIEAMFLGIAGLLDELEEEEKTRMKKEFCYLSHKFELPSPMRPEQWKYLRTRPKNFPHVRIRQIAKLYEGRSIEISSLLETEDIVTLQKNLTRGGISIGSRNLLVINTVAPLLYAYGKSHQDNVLKQRAIDLLQQLPPENNYILRQWAACELKVKNAADSQALIQLKKNYCDRMDCLRCRFGYEYLKQR